LANSDVERGNGVSPSSAIRRVILASAKARLIVNFEPIFEAVGAARISRKSARKPQKTLRYPLDKV
jgi:hypothetical protein